MKNYGAITAVKLATKDHVYVGQGLSVSKYNLLSGERLWTKKIFGRNKIHGLDICGDGLLAFGGDSILITDLECETGSERSVGDWICDAKFDGSAQIHVLTAHNQVISLHVKGESVVVSSVETCKENSLLYSGSIHVGDGSVWIASGTVLHGTYIWTLGDGKILRNFTSHEGSIFNVQISPDRTQVLSCSDDRFIKLFDMSTGEEVATGFGHGARIWQVAFLGNNQYLSSSEDATAILWKLEGDSLEVVTRFEGHVGKNAWCFDHQKNTLVTGGGDGRWRVYHLEVTEPVEYTYSEVAGHSGAFKNFVNLSFDNTAVGTAGGQVLIHSKDESSDKWTSIFEDDSLKSLCLLAGWRGTSYVAAGNRFGQVFVINIDTKEVKDVQLFEGKISNLLTRERQGKLYLLGTSQNEKEDSVLVEIGSMNVTRFPAVAGFPVTSFDISSELTVFGSRYGAVSVVPSSGEPSFVARKVINDDTVTDLLLDNGTIFMATRNGYYGRFSIVGKTLVASLLNKSGQSSIYRILSLSPSLVACGFKTNAFFIYNESQSALLFSADCGGAHRSWDLHYDSGKVLFNFVRKAILNEIRTTVPAATRLGYYSHGREVRGIVANGNIVASGAEDTNIMLTRITEEGLLENLFTYRKHTSGIQGLKWASPELLISSSAREELVIWKYANGTLSPWLELPKGDNPDLRIMDFVYIDSDSGFDLICAYSDSTLRLWRYQDSKFSLVETLKYTQHCLLNVDLLSSTEVVISATDGSLSVYSVPGFKPLAHVYAHQSSVRFCISGNLIFSGGDDNKLCVTEYKDGKLTVLASEPSAHSSTITEVAMVGDNSFVSVSVDQNVRTWSWNENSKLVRLTDKFTTVADTGCVCPYEGGLLIGGAGLSYWKGE